jgi:hypothetical protein
MKESVRSSLVGLLPVSLIFDNLFVRVSAVAGRHSCEKGK